MRRHSAFFINIDFTIFPRFNKGGVHPEWPATKTGGQGTISISTWNGARDKPSGSSTRSRAESSGAGQHAREVPAAGQSARSRKPSVKGLASRGCSVSSGERGLYCCGICLLVVLVVRKDQSTPTPSAQQNKLPARPAPRQERQVRGWCANGRRRQFGPEHAVPPPPRLFALGRGIQSDCPACFL